MYGGNEIIIIIDINECLLDTDNCHVQAICNNIIGSFSCTCKEGYSGNGISCDGMISYALSLKSLNS